jgi:hypothetical protein
MYLTWPIAATWILKKQKRGQRKQGLKLRLKEFVPVL